jgi:hypothetical protein
LIGGVIEVEDDQTTVVTDTTYCQYTSNRGLAYQGTIDRGLGHRPSDRDSFTLNRTVSEVEPLAGRRDFTIASVKLGEDLNVDALLSIETERAIMRPAEAKALICRRFR